MVCIKNYFGATTFRSEFIPSITPLQSREVTVLLPTAAGKTPLTLPGSHNWHCAWAARPQVLSCPGQSCCSATWWDTYETAGASVSPRQSPVPQPQMTNLPCVSTFLVVPFCSLQPFHPPNVLLGPTHHGRPLPGSSDPCQCPVPTPGQAPLHCSS